MKKQTILKSQEGFTLVEIIAVLIILGILAAVAVPRYIDLETNARTRAIDAAISELNGRESLSWADVKISPTGWTEAAGAGTVWTKMTVGPPTGAPDNGHRPFLGTDYQWDGGATPAATGPFALRFKGQTSGVALTRTPPTANEPGVWRKTTP